MSTSRQLVTVQDETTPGTLTPKELFNIVWALKYQAIYHYGRSAWVSQHLAPAAHVVGLPRGAKPPVGAWNIVLLDTSDVEGALGYHEDEKGNNIPFSEVFIKTARQDGVDPAEVASHEMLEMLVDPDVTNVRKVLNKAKGEYVIVEVGDPVQGCGYAIGESTVADFVEPAWFDLGTHATHPAPKELSHRGSVSKAFELAPRGYISIAPESDPENWSQVFGGQRDQLPSWASRLPRIHGL